MTTIDKRHGEQGIPCTRNGNSLRRDAELNAWQVMQRAHRKHRDIRARKGRLETCKSSLTSLLTNHVHTPLNAIEALTVSDAGSVQNSQKVALSQKRKSSKIWRDCQCSEKGAGRSEWGLWGLVLSFAVGHADAKPVIDAFIWKHCWPIENIAVYAANAVDSSKESC